MPASRSEFELIAAVAARVGTAGDLIVGIGDDCAVLPGDAEHDLLVTTDLLVEDRHFVRAGLDPRDLGWKALAVSISDVAAMGGRATAAVVGIALPRELTGDFADGVTDGLAECAERFGVAIAGGDTSSSPGPVFVNTTVLGRVAHGRAVLRSGGRPGDAVCVTGALGGSLLGRHLRPIPRQDAALSLVQGGDVHALIDLSDGLSSDLGHVTAGSGCGAVVFADRVPLHADAQRMAAKDGLSALEHALHDGEDYELLFTVPVGRVAALETEGLAGTPVRCVGELIADTGLWLDVADERIALTRGGHDHFRNP